MFQACAHYLAPERFLATDSDDERAKKEAFELQVRSRIEHLFARIDRHRCLHYNLHTEAVINAQMNFLLHLESINFEMIPCVYDVPYILIVIFSLQPTKEE